MSTEFNCQIRVYYEDTDAGGVVFYANYLRFMERARTEWLRHIGFEHKQLIKQRDLVFAVKSVSIDYKKPAKLDDLLTVASSIIKHRKNFEIVFTIFILIYASVFWLLQCIVYLF